MIVGLCPMSIQRRQTLIFTTEMFPEYASLGVSKPFKYPVSQTQASEQRVLKELCTSACDFQGMMLNPPKNKHHGIFVNT